MSVRVTLERWRLIEETAEWSHLDRSKIVNRAMDVGLEGAIAKLIEETESNLAKLRSPRPGGRGR